MGVVIAIEGLDGAGKATLTGGLTRVWADCGARVATVAFPRYHASIHADIAAEALRGGHGDLASSAYAMATLFALDRADARDHIASLAATHDAVLLDRYVASNLAYTAARCHEGIDGAAATWVDDLEFGRFKLPVPDHQLFVDVSATVAMDRAAARAVADTSRERDAYERDGDLQTRVEQCYRDLADAGWRSPWTLTTGEDIAAIATSLLH